MHDWLLEPMHPLRRKRTFIRHDKITEKMSSKNKINTDPNAPANTMFHPELPIELELGLTKREHFAVLAMQGLLSGGASKGSTLGVIVRRSVILADALIDELNNHRK